MSRALLKRLNSMKTKTIEPHLRLLTAAGITATALLIATDLLVL